MMTINESAVKPCGRLGFCPYELFISNESLFNVYDGIVEDASELNGLWLETFCINGKDAVCPIHLFTKEDD